MINIFYSILIILCSFVFSATLEVPSQYPTIQEAIDASIDEDTVSVAPGYYFDGPYMITKSIVLAKL